MGGLPSTVTSAPKVLTTKGNHIMNIIWLLVLLLVLGLVLPVWPYSSSWGYYPGGSLLVLILIIILLSRAF